ncbi:MAG: hypothetical protein U0871_26945 [Gemmataceae bacterium]
MAVVESTPLQVGIAGPIRSDPELLEAVREATDYLQQLIQKHHLDPAERELVWGCSDQPRPEHLLPVLRETDRYGSRHASPMLSRATMLDPIDRGNAMSALLRDVLRERWYQIRDVIDRGIRELELEESRHAAVSD